MRRQPPGNMRQSRRQRCHRGLLALVLERAAGVESLVGAGEGELFRQHQYAQALQDGPHMDQAAQASQSESQSWKTTRPTPS